MADIPDISTDLASAQVDYLHVRTYLYKFTPDMSPSKLKSVGLSKGTASNLGGVQDRLNQLSQLDGKMRTINSRLNQLNVSDLFVAPNNAVNSQLRRTISGIFARVLELPEIVANDRLIILPASGSEPAVIEDFVGGAETNQVNKEIRRTRAVSGARVTKNNTIGLFGATLSARVLQAKSFLSTQFVLNNDNQIAEIARTIKELQEFFARVLELIPSLKEGAEKFREELQKEVRKFKSDIEQFLVRRFEYDLSTEDISRFDISDYVSGYDTTHNLGLPGNTGTLQWSLKLQDKIIPFSALATGTSINQVRRPIFYPAVKPESGTDLPIYQDTAQEASIDPVTGQGVSTLGPRELVTRIAQLQTMEDGNSDETSVRGTTGKSIFEEDVKRIEIAMRLRGITDPIKKEAIIAVMQGDPVDKEIERIMRGIIRRQFPRISRAEEQTKVDELIAEVKKASSGTTAKLSFLKAVTVDSEDGILVRDLIQKFDYVTAYVYRGPVHMDRFEDLITQDGRFSIGNSPTSVINQPTKAPDVNFFDKEAFLTKARLHQILSPGIDVDKAPKDTISLYNIDFSGFVTGTTSLETPGKVNNLMVNGGGPLVLFAATRRLFNPTIFAGTIFDVGEVTNEDHFTVFQNLFADKDPLKILEVIIDSLMLVRTRRTDGKVTVNEKQIALGVRTAVARARAADATTASIITDAKIAELTQKAIDIEQKKAETANPLRGKRVFDKDDNLISYLDIVGQIAFNQFGEKNPDGSPKGSKNIFNMASFLYANVMRMRGFNTRLPKSLPVSNPSSTLNPTQESINDVSVTTSIKKQNDDAGGSILEISPTLGDKKNTDFEAYFLFLAQGFDSFTPELKSPLEIMDDVSRSSYIEFFETPSGRMIFRTPQYNNNVPVVNSSRGSISTSKDAKRPSDISTTEGIVANSKKVEGVEIQSVADKVSIEERNMLTSDDIIPINVSYAQSLDNVQSKLQLGFGADIIGLPISIMRYHYTNGKILSQYGLRMSSVEYNPNVRFSPINDKKTGRVSTSLFLKGMFAYARFFLEYMNMATLTGQITAVGDPKIQAGRTYFDAQNHKFGYINSVSKSLQVGGTYTASFTMMGVRDAVYSGVKFADEKQQRVEFRILPTLEAVMAEFAKNANASPPSMNQQAITVPPIQGINPYDVDISKSTVDQSTLNGQFPSDFGAEEEERAFKQTLRIDNLKDVPRLNP